MSYHQKSRIAATFTAVFSLLVGLVAAPRPYEPMQAPNPLTESWRWTELEALRGSAFTCATEDSEGVLWFGDVNGLTTYDGLETTFHPIPESFKKNNPYSIFSISDGRIFVGMDERIVSFKEGIWKSELEFPFPFWGYENVLELEEGAVLVGATGGMYLIDETGNHKILHSRVAFSGLYRHGNDIWFSENRSQNLVRWPLENGKLSSPERIERYSIPGPESWVRYFSADKNGQLYCSSGDADYSILKFNAQLNLWTKEDIGYSTGSLTRPERWISRGHDGNLMIRTSNALICQQGGKWIRLNDSEIEFPETLPFHVFRADGNTLIGSQRSKVYNVITSERVSATNNGLNLQFETANGNLWYIDQNGAVVLHEPGTGRWTQYDGCIDTPTTLIQSGDGQIWASGSDQEQAAIAILENNSWTIRHYPELGLRFCYLSSYQAADGKLYFGSGNVPEDHTDLNKGGILQIEYTDRGFIERHFRDESMPLRTYGITQTPDGAVWYGGNGLTKLTYGENDFEVEFPSPFIAQWIDHLICDSKGRLWVALWGIGIYRYQSEKWTLFDYADGIETNNVAYLVELNDSPGSILAVTDIGYAKFDGVTWSHQPFPKGLKVRRENATLIQSSNNALWLNTQTKSWYNRIPGRDDYANIPLISTKRFQSETIPPHAIIKTFQDSLPETANAYISWTGQDTWDQTPVRFLEYSQRLNESSWSPFTRSTETLLPDLPAGTHTFSLKARDFAGNVQAVPASVSFEVIAPVWKRVWFQLLMLLIFLLIVALTIQVIRQRIRHIKEIEEIKIKFFTNISHELRTPLTVISGPLESALAEANDSKLKQRLTLALKGAQKTMRLVDQLLDFRKYDNANWPSRFVQGDIVTFIKESVSLHEPIIQQKGQTLEFSSNLKTPIVSYDEEKLPKIIDNLVSNASKYSPDNGLITINIREDLLEEHISIQVEDTGCGIDASEQEKIFDAFHRAKSNKQTAQEKGTGLGLSLTRSLIRSLNGQIEVLSPAKDNKGTRFTVHLPVIVQEDKAVSLLGADLRTVEPDSSQKTILIAEDDDDIRKFLSMELSDTYNILEAENGKVALKKAVEEIPDLIITDVMMPEMDGRELCSVIKADEKTNHIPVVMLTALTSDTEKLKGLEASADDYVTKPIKPAHLKLKIQNRFQTRERHISHYREEFLKPKDPIKRPGNSPQNELFVDKVMSTVKDNLSNEQFDVQKLAELMNMSRVTLYRKLKAMTGETPNAVIQKLRLKHAAELLLEDKYTVSEIVELIGYNELSYFSSSFKKFFKCKPSEYKAIYEQNQGK